MWRSVRSSLQVVGDYALLDLIVHVRLLRFRRVAVIFRTGGYTVAGRPRLLAVLVRRISSPVQSQRSNRFQ